MPKDFYEILGLSRSASKDDIKKAYRKLSKEWHPDKHKGDKKAEERYKEINQAYETLSNDKKKQMYDQFGTTGGGGGPAGAGGFDFSGFQTGDFGGLGDIFESFFGGGAGGRGRRQPGRGGDVQIQLTIDFAEAVAGTKKTISLRKQQECAACGGSGNAKGSSMKTCETCKGTGQVVRTAQSFFGTVQQSYMCSACNGRGSIPEKPCTTCGGAGRVHDKTELTIDIPAGIHDGQSLKISGKGDAGEQGSPAGDLFVLVRVRADARFVRDGDDVRTTSTISVVDAILGTQISVETVHGAAALKIPEGTQSGQVMRIKGKGMPVLGTSRNGDHFVKVTVEIPKKLSRKERKVVEQWKELTMNN